MPQVTECDSDLKSPVEGSTVPQAWAVILIVAPVLGVHDADCVSQLAAFTKGNAGRRSIAARERKTTANVLALNFLQKSGLHVRFF